MDQTIVVTGAASGIGRAVAERLLQRQTSVFAIDRNIGELQEELSERHGSRIRFLQADITDEEAVRSGLEASLADLPPLAGLVNAAGFGGYSEIVDSDAMAWRNIVDVCLTGTYVMTKVVGGAMRRHGSHGAIVNIASTNAQQPAAGMSAYCSAKAGVEMFTKVAAMELGAYGIRVIGVGPGLTATPLTGRLTGNAGLYQSFLDNIPLGRAAEPADIAASVLFLLSEDAGYITGQTLYVDGGMLTKAYPDLKRFLSQEAS
jgi:NAD(P)-dependent dehydrogenase (short-subunit alcohol dehydrogenase family)